MHQSGVRGTIQGFETLMLVILLYPPPSQDFALLWSDCGAEVPDSLLKSPAVLCVCMCAPAQAPAHTLVFLLVDFSFSLFDTENHVAPAGLESSG